MSAQSKSIIKTYFTTGSRPTQAQFANLIDSYQDANSNLQALASAGTGAVGLQVLAAATTAAAQSALGGGTVGRQVFACVTTAAAQAIVGAAAGGDMLKATYDAANVNQQLVGISAPQTVSNKIVLTATVSAAAAGLNLPHGAAPSAPNNGDLWTTTSGLFARINGSTTQFSQPQFTLAYTSTDQTITSGGNLTLPHGLGVAPKFWATFLVCQTGEAGYTAGDVVRVADAAATGSQGHQTKADATNIGVVFGSSVSVYNILNYSGGASANLTNANWRLRVRAWA